MRPAFFFGYGSLVNRHTHRYDAAHAASVRGWRRAWRYTPDRQVAYLTAVRDADCRIDGLVAAGLSKFVIRPIGDTPVDEFIDRFVAELLPRQN